MTYRWVIAVALVALLTSCSGGGGGSILLTTPASPWPRFRHDQANTGGGNGAVPSDLTIRKQYAAPAGRPISASPAIGLDHTVYITTEGGELIALNPDVTEKWRVTAGCGVEFGVIRSSPAVTGVRASLPATAENDKIVFFGDDNGRLFAIQDRGTQAVCLWVFQGDPSPIVSSPAFTIDGVEQIVTGVYVGTTGGFFYAVNRDGTLKWRYPAGGTGVGAITSSPALDGGGPVYFTAADGNLYAVTLDGALRFRAAVGAAASALAPSPARGSGIYVTTQSGNIVAINSDGSFRWSTAGTGIQMHGLASSVALGASALPVATPTAPMVTATPGVPTPTVTPPIVPLARTIIFVVASDGAVYALDEHTGLPAEAITIRSGGPSVSSPAIFSDGCLLFGDNAGNLWLRNPISSLPVAPDATPTPTPAVNGCMDAMIPLTGGAAIRSSPAIDDDGSIYVGADDGRLYAIKATNS